MKLWASLFFILFLTNCATYRWGFVERSLPGGYKQIYIPVFKNYTQEPGIEMFFTNAIRQEFERSKIARLAEPNESEVELIGEITNVGYTQDQPLYNKGEDRTWPTGTVLAGQYIIDLNIHISIRKKSDQSILWQGDFGKQRNYIAPQVSTAGVNSVNPLYNLSARRLNIEVMSLSMMSEAHDRITENF